MAGEADPIVNEQSLHDVEYHPKEKRRQNVFLVQQIDDSNGYPKRQCPSQGCKPPFSKNMTKPPKQPQRQPAPGDVRSAKSSFSGSLEGICYPRHHQSFEDVIDILQAGSDRTKRKAVVPIKVIPTIDQVSLELKRETENKKEYQTDHAHHCCSLGENKSPVKEAMAHCPTRVEQ